jgi:hypothetical protein
MPILVFLALMRLLCPKQAVIFFEGILDYPDSCISQEGWRILNRRLNTGQAVQAFAAAAPP